MRRAAVKACWFVTILLLCWNVIGAPTWAEMSRLAVATPGATQSTWPARGMPLLRQALLPLLLSIIVIGCIAVLARVWRSGRRRKAFQSSRAGHQQIISASRARPHASMNVSAMDASTSLSATAIIDRALVSYQPVFSPSAKLTGSSPATTLAPTPIATDTSTLPGPWLWLRPGEVLEACGLLAQAIPVNGIPIPEPRKRIYELQARLGATRVAIAPDLSLVVFPGIALPRQRLQKIAAPQPVILTATEDGEPIVIVSLTHPDAALPPVLDSAPASALAAHAADAVPAAPVPQPSPQSSAASHVITRPAHVSDELPLSIESFISEVFVIAGKRRSGKSYSLGVILEEMARHRLAFAAVDLEGEMYGLREAYPVVIVGKRIVQDGVLDLEARVADAGALATWAMRAHRQVVLDLSGYSRPEQISFVAAFGEALWRSAMQERHPFTLVMDEAHELYSQQRTTEASEVLDRLILRGAKWGIGIGLATQRPANLAITARTQAGIAILHPVEQARDVAAYADMLPSHWTEARITEAMQRLGRGQAIVKVPGSGAATVQVVSIRERTTPHMGYTPTMHRALPPTPGRLRLPAALMIELRAALQPAQLIAPAPVPETTDRTTALVDAEPDDTMLERLLCHVAFEPDGARSAALMEGETVMQVQPQVISVLMAPALSAVEQRLLTLAVHELEGRWPIKQLWQHVRGEGIVSWDELAGKVTPRLANAGYLVKDHLGRWTLTSHAHAIMAEWAA